MKRKSLKTKASLYVTLFALGVLVFAPLAVRAAGAYNAVRVFGQLTGGNPDFTTSGSGTSPTALSYTAATAIDTIHHRLFIIDSGNNRIIVHNLSASNDAIDYTADNVLGQLNFTSSGGGTAQSALNGPYIGLAYDSANDRLFVADNFNGRIVVYDLSGGITNGMNASNELGKANFNTNFGLGTTQDNLSSPWGIALNDAGSQLFVADRGNNRVMVFNVAPGSISDGMNASNVLGQLTFVAGSTGSGQSGLNTPETVAYDSDNKRLFVGDSGNNRIMMYDLSGGITDGMNASRVIGQSNFGTTGANLTQSGLGTAILGLGYDTASRNLYVSDRSNNRVLVYNLYAGVTNGMNASTVIGAPDFTTAPTCTAATANNFCHSEGNIAIDQTRNRVYIPDSTYNRVLAFDFALMPTIPTSGTLGSSFSGLSGSQTNGTPTYSVLSGALPDGLSLDATTGAVTGTPTKAGAFSFVLGLADSMGAAGSFRTQQAYTITIPAPPSLGGTVGVPNTGLPASSPFASIAAIVTGTGLLAGLTYWRRRSYTNGRAL